MKHIIFIIFIGIVALTSCNNRTTERDSLEQAVSRFKKSLEPIEFVEYFPNGYSEKRTDTILSNGVKVSIKSYTDMNRDIIHKTTKDTISVVTEIHRKWVSEVKIEKNGELIFNETIDDAFFQKYTGINTKALLNTINLETAINTDNFENSNNYIIIDTGLKFIKENKHFLYSMRIDESGNFSINQSYINEEII